MSRLPDDHRTRGCHSTIRGAVLFFFLAGLSLGRPAPAAGSLCTAAEPLFPGATVQREAGAPGGDLYELALLEPGVLELHVSAPIAAGSRPRLALPADCASSADGAGWGRVRETPQGLMLRIREAVTLYIGVSAEDPEVPLAAYTLRSTFVPEITPEPFAQNRFDVVERSLGLEKDIDPWEDDEISGLVAEPGMIVFEGGETLFFALCAADTDHDRPLCGAPLTAGEVASGTIDGAADDDYYAFTLDRRTRVAVEVGGGEEIRGVLYDGGGQRLETWAGSLVQTLGAGRFYVRVGSIAGWVGEYAVGVELIP